jgi:5-formaminoimidazole-4-carboxamide-1-beta-D-ribofuranosyl 5'-monophosphate synthetase
MAYFRAKNAAEFYQAKQAAIEEELMTKGTSNEKRIFELVSDTQMFEMLYFNGKSAPITITDTLIFDSGRPCS